VFKINLLLLTLIKISYTFLNMKIAITFENENVFQHFGHTKQFKLYDIENNSIVKTEVVDTNGQGHGALASFLKNLDVQVLICGGIGEGAQVALGEAGIKIFGGVNGSCDDAAKAFAAGTLEYNPNVKCNHHGEHEHSHGEGHNCDEHSCVPHNSENQNDSSKLKFIPV